MGNGGSQSDRSVASVMPGYSGARSWSTASPAIGTTPATRKSAVSVTSAPASSHR